MTRKKSVIINSIFLLIMQFVIILCGIFLPRLFLVNFGSEVNGLVSSITQFLGYIALLDAGVGGVVRASLYKPLAEKDNERISLIMSSCNSFFKKVAFIFLVYVLILSIIYPFIVKNFEFLFTFSLIIIISISSFAEYYFGISYQQLIQSDQKYWIVALTNIVTSLLNLLVAYILIKCGCNVHIVKLGSAVVFILRPLVFNIYARRKYRINTKVKPDKDCLKGRWDGLGQHIAYFINSNTDITILTIIRGVLEVSVYAVYYAIVSGMQKITLAISQGMSAALGDMYARDEKENLKATMRTYSFTNTLLTCFLFTVTAIMIVPFVKIYTRGITDINYIRPVFAYLLVFAQGMYCIREPFGNLIYSVGHYKQTKKGAYIEAGLNITISIILVFFLGLIGVAIGTCIAMTYRTLDFIFYLRKNIVNEKVKTYLAPIILNIIVCCLLVIFFKNIYLFEITNYLYWVVYAVIVSTVVFIVLFLFNFIVYRNQLIKILKRRKK